MYFLRLLVVASIVVPYNAFLFQNSLMRFIFRRMTPDANWPTVKDEFKPMEKHRYFDPDVEFPEYYRRDFHAYTGGNLNPIASKEAMSATSAVMDHHYKHLSGEESSHYIRRVHSVMSLGRSIDEMENSENKIVVDFGCGIGVSTRYLSDDFKNANVTGIDLSPLFLEETEGVDAEFVHGNIENTGIESGSVDVVSISYVLHELPYDVSMRVVNEAYRILKPGTGVFSILDMHNPSSSSPVMKYIFDRTEPYLQEYSYLLKNMSRDLQYSGFRDVRITTEFPKTIMVLCSKKRVL